MTETQQTQILNDWLSHYRGLVFKVVRAYAFTTMDQDDLFQEIMIQVWRSIPAFRQESSPTTWIYRIALNTAIKWTRRERRHYTTESLDDAGHILSENKTQGDDRLTWLYEEISNLDEIDRSITLLLLDNFSYKEIAGIIGITESNVGVKINRIKKILSKKIKKTEDNGI